MSRVIAYGLPEVAATRWLLGRRDISSGCRFGSVDIAEQQAPLKSPSLVPAL
jgi:hypothetical protein